MTYVLYVTNIAFTNDTTERHFSNLQYLVIAYMYVRWRYCVPVFYMMKKQIRNVSSSKFVVVFGEISIKYVSDD